MKRRIPWLALLLVPAVFAPAARAADIAWVAETWEGGLAQAQATHRPMMVLFHLPGCESCERFDRVLAEPDVVRASAHYTCVRIDTGTPAGRAVAARFHSTGTPDLLFCDPEGHEIDRIEGNVEAAQLASGLERIWTGRSTIPDMLARAAAHASEVPFNATLGYKLARGGDPRARAYLDRAIALDSLNTSGKVDDAWWGRYVLASATGDTAGALGALEHITRDYPTSNLGERAFETLAALQESAGRRAEAVATLKAGVAAFPADAGLRAELQRLEGAAAPSRH